MKVKKTCREIFQFWSTSNEETSSSSYTSTENDPEILQGTITSPSSEYLVQGFVGEGSFGKVAKCLKSATNENVAIKIIKSKKHSKFHNELSILRKLRAFDAEKFNFVKFIDDFIYRGHICQEFEMLDINLGDYALTKPGESLPVKELRPILHQMATTLQLLSSLGLVHTDLKPDNIVMVDHVNQPLKVKMIDFGLACDVAQLNMRLYNQPLAYRSPEVILGIPCNTAIDMWSLGCIAAELFLGHMLFPVYSEFHMLQQMTQVQGQMPQNLLKKGSKTRRFFNKKKGREAGFTLKAIRGFGKFTKCESVFNSLDDLKKIRPVCLPSDVETMAEIKDQDDFVDLLKKMLQLECGERITPDQLLEDPFITMTDLSHSFPNSVYTKESCEMMEVCLDQASTSAASQVDLACHSRQEHPLDLEIAEAVYSGPSVHDDPRPSQPQPGKKRKKKTDRQGDDSSPESFVKEKKRIKMDPIETHAELSQKTKEDPVEASSIPVPAKKKRKRAHFVASHSGLSDSPERKKAKISLHEGDAQTNDPGPSQPQPQKLGRNLQKKKTLPRLQFSTSEDNSYRGRKRKKKRDTQGDDSSPESFVKEKKRIKMDSIETHAELRQKSKEDPAEASSIPVPAKRKRKRAHFVASHSELTQSDSPERKKAKMSLHEGDAQTSEPHNPIPDCPEKAQKEAQKERPGESSLAELQPRWPKRIRRKTTWFN